MNMTSIVKYVLVLCVLFVAGYTNAQITINTNFSVLSNQPIDSRDTLTTLADTSSVTWTFPGLLSYVVDIDEFWYYTGTQWRKLFDGTTIPSTVPDSLIVYAPAHGLSDTIALYGYVPVKADFTRANSTSIDSVFIAYAIDAPDTDSLTLIFSGVLTYGSWHGKELNTQYYLQDDGSDDTTPGTVSVPTTIASDSLTLFLREVGSDIAGQLRRVAMPSPLITAFGGNPASPTDAVVQAAIEGAYLPAGLAQPGTIFTLSYATQSYNPTYQQTAPNTNPLTPSYAWLWDGAYATRIVNIPTSVNLQDVSYGVLGTLVLLPIDSFMAASVPTDTEVALWLDTNYTANNLRLANGSLLYFIGDSTRQNPEYIWQVIDDISYDAGDTDWEKILKKLKFPGASEPDSTIFATVYALADTASAIRGDMTSGGQTLFKIENSTTDASAGTTNNYHTGSIGVGNFSSNTLDASIHIYAIDEAVLRLSDLCSTDTCAISYVEFFRGYTAQELGKIGFTQNTDSDLYIKNTLGGGSVKIQTDGITKLQVKPSGQLVLSEYGDTTFTGTIVKYLGVTDSGDVVEGDGGGGGGGYWTQTGSDIYYNSGKVGIGDTSPDYELDVLDASGPAVINVETQGVSNAAYTLFVNNSGNTMAFGLGSSSNSTHPNHAFLVSDNSNVHIKQNGVSTAIFKTDNSAVFTNNIGVGVTTPATDRTIHAHGTASTDPDIYVTDVDVSTPFTGVFGDSLCFVFSTFGTSGGLNLFSAAESGVTSGAITFQGHNGSTAPTVPIIDFRAYKSDGGTGRTAITGAEKIVSFSAGTTESMAISAAGVIIRNGGKGAVSTSTDGSGDVTVTHGLGGTPDNIQVTITGTTPYVATVHTIGGTTFKVRIFDMAGAAVASTAVTFHWVGEL